MDTLTKQERSERMSRIRGKDTNPEMVVRRSLHRLGYRYRLHRNELPGKPDVVFASRKKIVFVHGCFWHSHDGCNVANRPKTRRAYWDLKFQRNKERDAVNLRLLRAQGWRALVIWECQTNDVAKLSRRLVRYLGPVEDNARRYRGRK